MEGISLAEIDAFLLASRGVSEEAPLQVVCPFGSQQIFCSRCGKYDRGGNKLDLLNNGWQIKHSLWYCPSCAPSIK